MNWNSPDLRGRRQLGLALFLVSLAVLFGGQHRGFCLPAADQPSASGERAH